MKSAPRIMKVADGFLECFLCASLLAAKDPFQPNLGPDSPSITVRCGEVRDNRVLETTRVRSDAAVPLKLVYHFMHAWSPTVDAYLAGSDAAPDERQGGPFLDSGAEAGKFHVRKKVDWIAVHEPRSGQFAVSRLPEAPDTAENVPMIWNVPGTYRKYYLKCFDGETVPAGFEGT